MTPRGADKPVMVVLDADTDAGMATAHQLLADDRRVVVAGLDVHNLIRISRGFSSDQVYALVADIHDPDQVSRVLSRAHDRFGQVDRVIYPNPHKTKYRALPALPYFWGTDRS